MNISQTDLRRIKAAYSSLENIGKIDGRYAITFSGWNERGLELLEELRLIAVDLAVEHGLDAPVGCMGTVADLMADIAGKRDRQVD